jgi:hypothetical protein
LVVARPITNVAEVTDLVSRLEQRKDVAPIVNLLANSASEQDVFRSWLAAWTGLEMLVQKRFRLYEDIVHQQIVVKATTDALNRYIDRVREIATGKQSLVDKFRVIAICLYASDPTDDIKTFRDLKKTRDDVIHRGKELPLDLGQQADQIRWLLRRYLHADLTRS